MTELEELRDLLRTMIDPKLITTRDMPPEMKTRYSTLMSKIETMDEKTIKITIFSLYKAYPGLYSTMNQISVNHFSQS